MQQLDGEHAAPEIAARRTAARRGIRRSLLLFFSIVGPGIITANADNDVGGIQIYSIAGAQFGHTMLWLLIPITIALIVTQEMCARMGAVTGKGLADLIRENFGVKVTAIVLLLFVLADLGNTAAEFAGIAYASPVFQQYLPVLTKYLIVPLVAVFVFTMVTRGNYKVVERVFFAFCVVYLSYVASGIMVHPPWGQILTALVIPHFTPTQAYVLAAIGVIGTTISPWMQFYIQSAVVEKGVTIKDYAYSRVDVITGAIVTDVIAFFIIVACAATIFVHNQHLTPGQHALTVSTAGDVATALQPLAGRYASLLFALGLLNAAIFTASILPLSTAYYVCEAFGFESGVQRRFAEAPVFYALYAGLIAIGGGIVLLASDAVENAIIFYSQVINGVLLPLVLVLMLLLINRPRIMGRYTNNIVFNVVAWATVIVVGVLTVISTAQTVFAGGG
ncbi:MAG TPA: Nramp family divalent metal transporter [Candidatus Baltobacteraceae bacterium]|nr:Nramp family divalent metal transporter [Candidatus Baltobacteraceae bacterium]